MPSGITFYNLALNYENSAVTAGAASLLIASVPIWTAVLLISLHEKLTAIGWCGVFVSSRSRAHRQRRGRGIAARKRSLLLPSR